MAFIHIQKSTFSPSLVLHFVEDIYFSISVNKMFGPLSTALLPYYDNLHDSLTTAVRYRPDVYGQRFLKNCSYSHILVAVHIILSFLDFTFLLSYQRFFCLFHLPLSFLVQLLSFNLFKFLFR